MNIFFVENDKFFQNKLIIWQTCVEVAQGNK
jgi:hypothetical protein